LATTGRGMHEVHRDMRWQRTTTTTTTTTLIIIIVSNGKEQNINTYYTIQAYVKRKVVKATEEIL
jgi:uncharacterized protein YjaZ